MPDDALTRRAASRVQQILPGGWRLDRLVGLDDTAARYAATHADGRRSSVRVLHLELAGEGPAKARLLREARLLAWVAHPGVPALLGEGTADDGAAFLVTEVLEGATLKVIAAAKPDRRLAPAEVLAIADQALGALAVVHAKGIVHCDIKPEKLFVTRDGALKLLDLGSARVRAAAQNPTEAGTLAFASPEQAQGEWESVDGRSDLFSLGATLFCLLTGRFVHGDLKGSQELLAAATKHAPKLQSISPGVPPPVGGVVDRALAFDRDQRWADAAGMQAAVRAATRIVGGAAPDLAAMLPKIVDEASIGEPSTSARPLDGGPNATVVTFDAPTAAPLPFAAGAARVPASPSLRASSPALPTGTIAAGFATPLAAVPFATPGAAPPTAPLGGPVMVSVADVLRSEEHALPFERGAAPAPPPSAPRAAPPAASTGTVFGARPSIEPELPFAARPATAPQPPAPTPEAPAAARAHASIPEPPAVLPAARNATIASFGGSSPALPFQADAAPAPAARERAAAPILGAPVLGGTGTVFGARPAAEPELPFDPHAGAAAPVAPMGRAAEPLRPDAPSGGDEDAVAALIPFETYARVKAALWEAAAEPGSAGGAPPLDRAEVLSRHGLDEVTWRWNEQRLADVLSRDAEAGRSARAVQLTDALRAAVDRAGRLTAPGGSGPRRTGERRRRPR